jgi:hypothetical protein
VPSAVSPELGGCLLLRGLGRVLLELKPVEPAPIAGWSSKFGSCPTGEVVVAGVGGLGLQNIGGCWGLPSSAGASRRESGVAAIWAPAGGPISMTAPSAGRRSASSKEVFGGRAAPQDPSSPPMPRVHSDLPDRSRICFLINVLI